MEVALETFVSLDPRRIIRALAGKYTGVWRNVKEILGKLELVVTPEGYDYINRILIQGVLSMLQFNENSNS